MTQDLSSLMDGELDAQEAERAIRSCCESSQHEETWHLYHVIGDTMRGQGPGRLDRSEAIRRSLREEPAIIARPRRIHETTFGRIALAAAASVATIGVVGWIGTQGGQLPGAGPVVAKNPTSIQPVSSKASLPAQAVVVDVQDYLTAHRQIPSADLYRTVNNRANAPAAAR